MNTLFDIIEDKDILERNKALIEKMKAPSKKPLARGFSYSKLSNIFDTIKRSYDLDKFDILNLDQLEEYIYSHEFLAIDTETTGKNVVEDTIVGICLFAEGRKPSYVPVEHVNYMNHARLIENVDKERLAEIMNTIQSKVIMHTAIFDMPMLLKLGIDIRDKLYWDVYVGARLLNENEESNSLKDLHAKYCADGEKSLSYSELTKGVPFALIPLECAKAYGGNDALMTMELFRFQEQYLTSTHAVCKEKGLERIAGLFLDLEMPLLKEVLKTMEEGVEIDIEYRDMLEHHYTDLLDKVQNKFTKKLKEFGIQRDVLISSPEQIAVLLYDDFGLRHHVKKQKPRSTDASVLETLDHPLASIVLEYRRYAILLKTFIKGAVDKRDKRTNKIHCSFNQVGTDTGRFSSRDPNLQNIPSESGDLKIRKMFIAGQDKVFISCDYSQQEPRITAHLSGDKKMIQAYLDKKDLYAEMASIIHNVPYEDCLEFYPDGTTNKAGKKRRNQAKTTLLSILYGKHESSLATDLGISIKEAQGIKALLYKNFPDLARFERDTINFAEENGYIETFFGRKRRFPDVFKGEFDFYSTEGIEIPESVELGYIHRLSNTFWKERKPIIDSAREKGIIITDNSQKFQDMRRQFVNSVIQGTASDMMKKAYLAISTDKAFNELGGKVVLQVHDELICTSPKTNYKQVADIIQKYMIQSADFLSTGIKCDIKVMERWDGEEYSETA